MAPQISTNTVLSRTQAEIFKRGRDVVFAQLYPLGVTSPAGSDPSLVTLANTFSRYASTQATAYDNGTAHASAGGGAGLLERQVERAMATVLGGAPGRNSDGFMNLLNGVFPTGANGQVQATPSRGVVSMSSPNGNGNTPNLAAAAAAGLAGQISAEQATLYRQAGVITGDALNVLAGLQSFVPTAESDRVEALRGLVGAEIQTICQEFGRLDEPRRERVESYLAALDGPSGHLQRLGEAAYLERGVAAPATIADEAQLAGFELLKSYVATLRTIWGNYRKTSKGKTPLFSERLARASVMLPVIAEGNTNFMSAMDSIGFTENERRSSSSRFTTLGKIATLGKKEIALPDMTVNDFNEWLDRFSNIEGAQALGDSGQYGLDFVTGQADRLFWVIVPILARIKLIGTPNLNTLPIVAQALTHERVSWALDDLFNQLKTLADLALAA